MTGLSDSGAGSGASEAPVLRVVRGNPDPAELAALVAVVTAASAGGTSPAPPAARSQWADPARSVRQPMTRGGWRASAAPR